MTTIRRLKSHRHTGIQVTGAIFIVLTLLCGHQAWLRFQNLQWKTAQATIISTDYQDLGGVNRLNMKYKYTVGEKNYACAIEQEVVGQELQPGGTLSITYNPGNPAESSFLDKDAETFMLVYSAIAITCLPVGIALFFWAQRFRNT